ncbi:MAG: hypothetical protein Q8P12_05275 [bacterium]|nr:hypothetical protein [bacterium]
MFWCFALINNRLGELYFDHDKKGRPRFSGHAYVDDVTDWEKAERKHIAIDIKANQFAYYRGQYWDKLRNMRYRGGKAKRFLKILRELRNLLSVEQRKKETERAEWLMR